MYLPLIRLRHCQLEAAEHVFRMFQDINVIDGRKQSVPVLEKKFQLIHFETSERCFSSYYSA